MGKLCSNFQQVRQSRRVTPSFGYCSSTDQEEHVHGGWLQSTEEDTSVLIEQWRWLESPIIEHAQGLLQQVNELIDLMKLHSTQESHHRWRIRLGRGPHLSTKDRRRWVVAPCPGHCGAPDSKACEVHRRHHSSAQTVIGCSDPIDLCPASGADTTLPEHSFIVSYPHSSLSTQFPLTESLL